MLWHLEINTLLQDATTCPYRLRGPPSCLWPKWGWGAHRAQLRCPHDVSNDMCECKVPPTFYRLPRPWSLWGSSPTSKNSHDRSGNRTRDLMASSKKLWPPRHEDGL
jgi:hypothetical protein